MLSLIKVRKKSRQLLSIWLIMLPTIPQVAAEQYQSHESIRSQAIRFVEQSGIFANEKMELTADRLDKRLRLSQCTAPLEAFSNNPVKDSQRVTIGVRCNDTPGWSLYLAVSVVVKKEILVAANHLPRGAILDKKDLSYQVHDIARLHRGYLDQLEMVVGKQLKRQLRINTPLNPGHISNPLSVKRNSQITILADIGPIQVRMNGKALGDASDGERVKVINSSSKREVEGIVVAPGVVRVTM